jgi:deoxyribonuclease V
MDLEQLAARQEQLAHLVYIPPPGQGVRPRPGDLIFALDIQYAEDRAFVGVDIREWQDRPASGDHTRDIQSEGLGRTGSFAAAVPVQVPYIPRFFCFREGPPLLKTITAIQKHFDLAPDLILVDGHGIAHPRRFGVACWVGLKTATPTIGCAKSTLLNYVGEIEKNRGSCLLIEDQGQIVGAALTTRDNVKPVFVSPGHAIDLDTAIGIILALSRYRIPDPLRRADHIARAYAQGQIPGGVTDLGELI